MDELTYHLSYLKSLLMPPTTYGWWPQVEYRAKELAKDPNLAELPSLVRAEYEKLRSASKASGLRPLCTSEPKINPKEKANEVPQKAGRD